MTVVVFVTKSWDTTFSDYRHYHNSRSIYDEIMKYCILWDYQHHDSRSVCHELMEYDINILWYNQYHDICRFIYHENGILLFMRLSTRYIMTTVVVSVMK